MYVFLGVLKVILGHSCAQLYITQNSTQANMYIHQPTGKKFNMPFVLEIWKQLQYETFIHISISQNRSELDVI